MGEKDLNESASVGGASSRRESRSFAQLRYLYDSWCMYPGGGGPLLIRILKCFQRHACVRPKIPILLKTARPCSLLILWAFASFPILCSEQRTMKRYWRKTLLPRKELVCVTHTPGQRVARFLPLYFCIISWTNSLSVIRVSVLYRYILCITLVRFCGAGDVQSIRPSPS